MEGGSETCLEREVEKLRESGMSVSEISARMGVDAGWVESLVALWEPDGESRDSG